jgi:hypothetical protein
MQNGIHCCPCTQAAATEEAARQLDSELTAMRSRLRAVEGSLKAKDAEVSKLCKQLDLKQGSEEELAARYISDIHAPKGSACHVA